MHNIKQAINALQHLYVEQSAPLGAQPAVLAVLMLALARWKAALEVGAWRMLPGEVARVLAALALLLVGRR